MIENPESLFIIGNGCDKNAGLSSSFSDFVKTVKTESNIWYLLFDFCFGEEKDNVNPIFNYIGQNNILWMDVEDLIKDILYMHRDKNESKGKQLSNSFGCETYIQLLNLAYNGQRNSRLYYNNTQFCALKEYFYKMNKGLLHIPEIDMVEFLKDQLANFENDFNQYIRKISLDNNEYIKKSGDIFRELNSEKKTFSILSFNYTIQDEGEENYGLLLNISHIHGSINEKVIIGFDSGDIRDNIDDRITMGKSFKKLSYNLKTINLPPKESIKTIKIYGHSLGEQDYSYFHTLFDYFDVYNNSNIKLEFYYTPHKKTEEENKKYREQYISSVYRMFNRYAFTSNVNTQTNVVINKLILENRLSIQKISKFS